MFVLKHQTVSRLLPESREKMSPTHALGVRFPTSPLPRFLEPPRSPHPAFRDVCQGGSGDPDGSLPTPTPTPPLVPLSLGFCSFSFFHGPSAKGLRKLPAPCPSRARSWGPGHTPGQARPCPCHLGRPAPSSGPLPPHSDPTEIAAPRAAPSEAAWGAAAPPAGRWSCTPERAVSPPEVLNFTLSGFSGRVGRASARLPLPVREQGERIRDECLAPRPFHSPPFRAAPLCPAQLQPFLDPPCSLFRSPSRDPTKSSRAPKPTWTFSSPPLCLPCLPPCWPRAGGGGLLLETGHPALAPTRRGLRVN